MANDALSKLQEMDDYEFEHLIANLWEEMGYQTEVSQQSQDKGVDVRAINQQGEKHLIQAKRHGPGSKVSQPKIQQYGSLYRQENNVDKVYVVTTNEFTPQAKEIADKIGVKLVNGKGLIGLINRSASNNTTQKTDSI